jgi:hypothetical protein
MAMEAMSSDGTACDRCWRDDRRILITRIDPIYRLAERGQHV